MTTRRERFTNNLLAALVLTLGLATIAGQPALPSGAYTSLISQSHALGRAELDATEGGVVAGYAAPTSSPSCVSPGPDEIDKCRELERQILASTVRIEWHVWTINNKTRFGPVDGGIGYATIKQGRYLVTHNHPGIPLSQPEEGTFITLSVFDAQGDPVWMAAPMSTLRIVAQEPETLVLDFGAFGGDGLFAKLGLRSAEFATWESLPLQAGMEVAQIDWDGTQARVEWTTVDALATGDGTPRLELANSVESGASGGGVFWNGYHIANTWFRGTEYGSSGLVMREYDVAALNSAQIASVN